MTDDLEDILDPAEIAALIPSAVGALAPARQSISGETASAPCSTRHALPEMPAEVFESPELLSARPFELPSFDTDEKEKRDAESTSTASTTINLEIELGRTRLSTRELASLRSGAVVSLEQRAGDPVDILVDGRLIARGEVLVLNNKFCVRVAELLGQPLGCGKDSWRR